MLSEINAHLIRDPQPEVDQQTARSRQRRKPIRKPTNIVQE